MKINRHNTDLEERSQLPGLPQIIYAEIYEELTTPEKESVY